MYKLQPALIMLSAVFGLFLGMYTPLKAIPLFLVEVFLLCLLFIVFLSIDVTQLKKSFLNIKYALVSVFINFVITPVMAYLLGILFLENSIAIAIGLMMLLVTPCTDWYLVFTKLSNGNFEINMSILPLNLLLQVLLLPLYLALFFGHSVDIEVKELFKNIAFILLVPLFFAVFFKKICTRLSKVEAFFTEKSDSLQILFLCLAVVVMFASQGENLLIYYPVLLKIFIPLLCFFVITYFVVQRIGMFFKFSHRDIIALHFTTLARNSPLGLIIAIAAFPTEPLIALSLIIGSLIELPILSFVSVRLRKKLSL